MLCWVVSAQRQNRFLAASILPSRSCMHAVASTDDSRPATRPAPTGVIVPPMTRTAHGACRTCPSVLHGMAPPPPSGSSPTTRRPSNSCSRTPGCTRLPMERDSGGTWQAAHGAGPSGYALRIPRVGPVEPGSGSPVQSRQAAPRSVRARHRRRGAVAREPADRDARRCARSAAARSGRLGGAPPAQCGRGRRLRLAGRPAARVCPGRRA